MPAGIYGYSLNEKSLGPHNVSSFFFLLSQHSIHGQKQWFSRWKKLLPLNETILCTLPLRFVKLSGNFSNRMRTTCKPETKVDVKIFITLS